MGKRHETIGIKQVVRLEWYNFALDLLLDGSSKEAIRRELDGYISERLQSGGYGYRGNRTYTKAVAQIIKCWVTPAKELINFRDAALSSARAGRREMRLVLHWAVTIAAYPFWHRVAEQTGRLLNLQDSICQSQVRQRCYEAFGERTTIERSARRVIRSFVEWGVLTDSETKGCYKKPASLTISDYDLAILLIEAVLNATPEGKGALRQLLNGPFFFPFQLPVMTGDFIAQRSQRINVVRYGLDDEYLGLYI